MPGQKEFEIKLEDEEKRGVSKNKEFDYDTAYLEVVQRRKYAWIAEGEEEKSSSVALLEHDDSGDDRKEEKQRE